MTQMGQRRPRKVRTIKTRYMVFTEGSVTEKQYLEQLKQHLRPDNATFLIKPVGGEPSKVFKEYESARKRGDVDYGVLIIDVDEHKTLTDVLQQCRVSTHVDAVVSNPCFELWLLWHKADMQRYIPTVPCCEKAGEQELTHGKHLHRSFPIENFQEAITRAHNAWRQLGPNEIGPNPSSAMPWFIDLLMTPPKES